MAPDPAYIQLNEDFTLSEALVYEDSPFAEYLASVGHEEALLPAEEVPPAPSHWDRLRNWLLVCWRRLAASPTEATKAGYMRASDTQLLDAYEQSLLASGLLADGPTFAAQRVTAPVTTMQSSLVARAGRHLPWLGALLSLAIAWAFSILVQSDGIKLMSSLWIAIPVAVVICWWLLMPMTSLLANWTTRQYVQHSLDELLYAMRAQDASIAKAIRTIQEIELVSRGYSITSVLPPISRIEQDHRARRAPSLRVQLLATFHEAAQDCATLLQTLGDWHATVDASVGVPMAEEVSAAHRMVKSLEYDSLDLSATESDDRLGLLALKQAANTAHAIRRACLTQSYELLHAHATRANQSTVARARMGVAGGQLGALWEDAAHRAMLRSKRVDMTLEREQRALTDPREHSTSASDDSAADRRLPILQRMSLLQQHLRMMQTRLALARDDMIHAPLLPENGDAECTAGDALLESLARLDAIGTDIDALKENWQQTRALLQQLLHPGNDNVPTSVADASSPNHAPISIGNETESSELIAFDWSAPAVLEPVGEETLYEGVASQRTDSGGNKLTREERIALQRERRKKEAQERQEAKTATSMVSELKSVLTQRKGHRPDPADTPTVTKTEEDEAFAVSESVWTPRSRPTAGQGQMLSELRHAIDLRVVKEDANVACIANDSDDDGNSPEDHGESNPRDDNVVSNAERSAT
ncbi:hypothetical protein THASP1DRAFT_28301 [Thamnocephalis sphaerospora]|uniref:Vezatin n=1 Tax=Thamnocephalis sphaerospora TaxID=78915 RepID=A0A4P9XUK7_9FUNG|nr:hypothetical protein THASP1DRAFT_28301 [Thamnocephalis sphaerospora]|eukprot:RKP09903.1 hypothetical protein THASP1DRAFT_28301 [Thamnocephalis sphaerospora]